MAIVFLFSLATGGMAAALDSPGLALIAWAALTWTGALFVCSGAPVVAGRGGVLNEPVAQGLSTAASLLAIAGTLLVLLSVA